MFHCRFCKNQCIKKGWQSYRQKLYCKSCRKYQQLTYSEHRVQAEHERMAVLLNNEGCSISSIGRITGFSKTTVCTIIARMGSTRALVSPVEVGRGLVRRQQFPRFNVGGALAHPWEHHRNGMNFGRILLERRGNL